MKMNQLYVFAAAMGVAVASVTLAVMVNVGIGSIARAVTSMA